LLTWGYPPAGSLKLVGDHYRLVKRQRIAVMRGACSDAQRDDRARRRIPPAKLAGRDVAIDGYNILITVEAYLAHAVVLRARDGCLRDLAGMHGSYRRVDETTPALEHIGRVLADLRPGTVHWILDKPVSNSGRLKTIIESVAAKHAWPWDVALSASCDRDIIAAGGPVITSDSAVLDQCGPWCNLTEVIVARYPRSAPIVDLRDPNDARDGARPVPAGPPTHCRTDESSNPGNPGTPPK